jgi:hypothetical protein
VAASSVDSNYTQVHPRKSEYDYLLNLYKCQSFQGNACSLRGLVVPSIGHFRSHLIDNEREDYCFYSNQISKQPQQTLDIQLKYLNNTPDYFVYVWYGLYKVNYMDNIVGQFQLNSSSENK